MHTSVHRLLAIENHMPWRKGKRLKVIAEREAQGRTLDIYQEIKSALGLPHVNLLFQAYAIYPQFLELHWRAMRAVVETREFFRLAARMGADAYTRMHNYFAVPDLSTRLKKNTFGDGTRCELSEMAELYHYESALMLLIVSIQLQAFDGRVGQDRDATLACVHPVFGKSPSLVEAEIAPPRNGKVYDDIKRSLGWPFLNTVYQAFGRWPEFFDSYWQVVKGVMQSPVYVESLNGTRDTAWVLAREIPRCVELTVSQMTDAGISDEDCGAIVRITELFLKTLTQLVLNAALARIGLEGGTVKASAVTGVDETPRAADQQPRPPGRAA